MYFPLPRILRKYPNVLVEFFAPWLLQLFILRVAFDHYDRTINSHENLRCPACVNFNPQLERLQAATRKVPLKVVKVT